MTTGAGLTRDVRQPAIRALVVDDDPGILAVVDAVLSEEGFEVTMATDGEEALEAALVHRPDVVLLDVMMPRLDGVEVCRMLRQNPLTAHMCVVMLTARTFPANKLMGLGAGADDYITKPFDPVDLPKRVRGAIRRNSEGSALDLVTRLPGPRQFGEMQARLEEDGSPFAVMHVDLDGFGVFTERYGPLRADMAVRQLVDCVRRSLERTAGWRGFVGHLGNDDLVVVVDAERAEAAAASIVTNWDADRRSVYDSEDAAAGAIEVEREEGTEVSPLMTVSIGVGVTLWGSASAALATQAAAEMQELARASAASAYEIEVVDDAPAREEPPAPEQDQTGSPLLRRSGRRGVPPRLWDQLAVLADLSREQGRRQVWLTPHPNSVVIVDDEEDIRDVLRLHCEMQGFPVVGEAADGAEAVRIVGEHQPTFVIMDYRMPNMDGAEAATHMRALHPGVKIIAFSGYLHERPSWADDFLTKEQIAHITPLLGRFLEMGAADRRKRR